MNRALCRSILILFYLALTSCRNSLTQKELIAKFYEKEPLLDSLVTSLQSNKKLDSIFRIGPDVGLPDIESNYPMQFELIKKLGITDASSFPNICRKCPGWFYLKTNWKSKYPIYLIYNYIGETSDNSNVFRWDSSENKKGFYKIDKYKNETWGLGGRWKMFQFVETIKDPVK